MEISRSPAPAASKSKMDRKIVEKNRRIHMKGLCFKLTSLIPSQHFKPSKDMLSQLDQLEQATNYIVQLRERVKQLKERKTKAMMRIEQGSNTTDADPSLAADSRYPIIELRDLGLCLEVTLISRLHKNFMLFQVVSVLEDEGAEVVGVHIATLGNKVYHTLHAQVKSPRLGVETSKIGARLHELIS